MNLLAITACASGVAHTYMAAEAIEKAAKERGHQIKVETQGLGGIENKITPEDVSKADAVIFASDITLMGKERFDSIRIFNVSVTNAIKNNVKVIEAVEKELNKTE